MKQVVIALGHKAQQGKSTVADYLCEHYPIQPIGFADELKRMCRLQYGMVTKNPDLLQKIGTEFREKNEDWWVNYVVDTIEQNPKQSYIITDLRYMNEARTINQLQNENRITECWEVVRMGEGGNQIISKCRNPNHPSETDLDDYSFDRVLIAMDGVLSTLHTLARDAYLDVMAKAMGVK